MRLRAVTFDVYSALYDITTGLAAAVGELFRRRGLPQDPVPVARAWRQKHMECDGEMQRALLAATLPVAFDVVISTEGGKFKPHPSVYARALDRLGVDAGAVLHVAGSPTDAMGATAAGLRTVWVNRAGDAVLDPRFAPACEVPDLRRVLAVLNPLV